MCGTMSASKVDNSFGENSLYSALVLWSVYLVGLLVLLMASATGTEAVGVSQIMGLVGGVLSIVSLAFGIAGARAVRKGRADNLGLIRLALILTLGFILLRIVSLVLIG